MRGQGRSPRACSAKGRFLGTPPPALMGHRTRAAHSHQAGLSVTCWRVLSKRVFQHVISEKARGEAAPDVAAAARAQEVCS